jgi:hypothetical protein
MNKYISTLGMVISLIVQVSGSQAQTRRVQQRGSDIGHGGDACWQETLEAEKSLAANLWYQIQTLGSPIYSDVDWNVYNWFIQHSTWDIVPEVFLNGESVEALSYRDKRQTLISRKKFCGLPPLRKQSILFHEHLVLAEMEDTKSFPISGRYISNQTTAENAKNWVCQSTAYLVVAYTPTIFLGGRENSIPQLTGAYYGATAQEAFNRMQKLTGHPLEWKQRSVCNRIQEISKESLEDRYKRHPDFGSSTYFQCIEPATIANSCVRN